ncbi:MAG TPA: hypothetical protein VHG28_17795 [Longimicrobiaceae bacterium]|nr:hypothetical protein [Longimicrobiaceae bacterium]
MHLHCRSCGTQIQADDVNLDTGLAKCRSCHAVFRFDTEPELAGGGISNSRARVEMPRSVARDILGGQLTFRHRWFSWKIVFLTFFCLFWDGFLVVWYGLAFAGDAPLLFKLFPLIHVAVGVGLTYYTIAGYVNSTTVTLDRGHLTVRHGPLPWPGGLDLDTSQFRQLYCEEKVTRGRNGPHYSYNLMVVMRDGGRKKLVSGLDTPDVSLFLEQEMEEWLKIRDEPVQGELRR